MKTFPCLPASTLRHTPPATGKLAWLLAVALAIGCADALAPRAGAAQLLGTWGSTSAPDYVSGVVGVGTGVRGPFFFGGSGTPFSGPGLFEDVVMTPADLGRRFVATPANDPDFDTVVAWLTNGQDDFAGNCEVLFPSGSGGGRALTESYFATVPGGSGRWDFTGCRIESIAMHVEQALLISPGRNPNHDGNWTDFNFARALEFYGSPIPEPGVGSLLCLGLAWLVVMGRRR